MWAGRCGSRGCRIALPARTRLGALEVRGGAAGLRQMSLSVEAANPAHQLYARSGFQTISRDSRDLLMLKRL